METITTTAGTFAVPWVPDCWFELDGIPSWTTAWNCPQPLGLMKPGPARKGQLKVPRAHGAIARRKWRDSFDVVLSFTVFAQLDPFGDPHPSEAEGIVSNLLYLGELNEIPSNPESTRELVVHLPDGTSTVPADVQVEVDWPETASAPDTIAAVTVTLFDRLVVSGS